MIHQDPVLSQVKLIAEPWDVGDGGYQVGNFPVLWAEWNGKYRDAIRRYWKGDEGLIGELAYRLTGSPDLYQHGGKQPYASINFITAHDGFTLNDLVSYNDKHNEANGEGGNDGDNNNASWNCGAEGVTDDEAINALRRRQRRNFLATMFLSQGVPMICGGDEYGRTQDGNNNAYCQDNELSWLDWDPDKRDAKLFEYTRKLIDLRRQHPIFRRPKFFQGRKIRGGDVKDVMWFDPNGEEMNEEGWNTAHAKCLGMLLSGDAIDVRTFHNEPILDRTYLLLLNAHHEEISFTLPGREKVRWEAVLDTMGRGRVPRHAEAVWLGRRVPARTALAHRVATGHRRPGRGAHGKLAQERQGPALRVGAGQKGDGSAGDGSAGACLRNSGSAVAAGRHQGRDGSPSHSLLLD